MTLSQWKGFPMTKITSSLFLVTLLALGLHVASAQAGLVRTCVSMAKGSDANASSQCHCSTPCRTFATAAANTLADGEITVLDPGDYGGLTITRSVSINNDSDGEASITVSGNNTTGIIVNANAGAYVNLRGITIQGVGFGTNTGLQFNSGFSLTMTNCFVRNLTGDGIQLLGTGSFYALSNTYVTDNGGQGIFLLQLGGTGTAELTLNRVEMHNNGVNGLRMSGSTAAVSIDSVATHNTSSGFSVAGAAFLTLKRSTAAFNKVSGILVDGTFATLSETTAWINGPIGSGELDLSCANGGSVFSYGDNVVTVSNCGKSTLAKY
jgi:Right handed beta helix region